MTAAEHPSALAAREVVTALVKLAPGATLSPEDVRARVGEHLAGYKKPRHVILVDELERSPSGKLDMRRLRAQAAAHAQNTPPTGRTP